MKIKTIVKGTSTCESRFSQLTMVRTKHAIFVMFWGRPVFAHFLRLCVHPLHLCTAAAAAHPMLSAARLCAPNALNKAALSRKLMRGAFFATTLEKVYYAMRVIERVLLQGVICGGRFVMPKIDPACVCELRNGCWCINHPILTAYA